jgi:hypothetical protein
VDTKEYNSQKIRNAKTSQSVKIPNNLHNYSNQRNIKNYNPKNFVEYNYKNNKPSTIYDVLDKRKKEL